MNLNDIKYLLTPAAESFLSKDSNFDFYLNYAIDLINDETGNQFSPLDSFTIDIQWLKIPLAWIIEYLVARKISGGSENYWQQCLDNYKKAMTILDEHKIQKNRAAAKPVLGSIDNVYGEL